MVLFKPCAAGTGAAIAWKVVRCVPCHAIRVLIPFAQQIGEMLRRQCADLTYARGDGTVQASVSVGAAELPEDSPNRLAHGLANAEIACKAAKDRGRDRVEIFQDADQSRTVGARCQIFQQVQDGSAVLAVPMTARGLDR